LLRIPTERSATNKQPATDRRICRCLAVDHGDSQLAIRGRDHVAGPSGKHARNMRSKISRFTESTKRRFAMTIMLQRIRCRARFLEPMLVLRLATLRTRYATQHNAMRYRRL
jgi:hypothetical protein